MKPVDRVKVIKAPARRDRNELYYISDGYDWVYEHPTYTKGDVVRPGFFNEYKDEMRVGAVIECRLGVIEEGIKRYWLQVIQAPRSLQNSDVLVSYENQKHEFVPVRHDGTLDEKEKAA